MGKVFPNGPVRTEIARRVSNRITIRKMFDAKRKELTYIFSPVNIQ